MAFARFRCTWFALLLLPLASAPTTGSAGKADFVEIGDGALGFIPSSAQAGPPAPLLILLHGASGRPADILSAFRDEAERRGIVLVAPASRAWNWDMLLNIAEQAVTERQTRAGRRPDTRMTVDPPRIRAAMVAIGRRARIHPARVALAGFSDGASYALTLGVNNPDQFPTLIAFSPGMLFLSRDYRGRQRVFISHGRSDPVLPFRHTAVNIVRDLRQLGAEVTFRRFEGGHVIPKAVKVEALDFLTGSRTAGEGVQKFLSHSQGKAAP